MQLLRRRPLRLYIPREAGEADREGNKVDYLPFGVKTLKVAVEGDHRGKLHLAPQRLSAVQGETQGHEDVGDPPQLVVSWGGGHESCCELDYPRQSVAHFLVNHVGQGTGDHQLTIEARLDDRDEVEASITVTLTYPTVMGEPWPPLPELVKPSWQEVTVGSSGESDIVLEGRYCPDYISRWWPHNRVIYDADGPPPPRVRLRYRRLADSESGDLTVRLASGGGAPDVDLALIEGGIPYPLYDSQQVLPELHRFGPQTWALRVWFFWLDKEISRADLRRWGTRTDDEVEEAWRGLAAKSAGRAGGESWAERHEIPDAERLDVVFGHDGMVLYAATDLHWHEMWGRCTQPGTRVQARIMNTKPAKALEDWQTTWQVIKGWSSILLTQILRRYDLSPPYNPQKEVVAELSGQGKLAGVKLAVQTHTPAFLNASTELRFISTDVTEG
jgi:hypothetical protein